jgi:hypothetical protein
MDGTSYLIAKPGRAGSILSVPSVAAAQPGTSCASLTGAIDAARHQGMGWRRGARLPRTGNQSRELHGASTICSIAAAAKWLRNLIWRAMVVDNVFGLQEPSSRARWMTAAIILASWIDQLDEDTTIQ